ncbi:dTDP-4-dehydrorhamnose 3,5-epimerase family protein [bacterium]|nr:dTDP-4-dehydrorhamnose 3,5-epimerase family protein [bacterium]
MENTNIKNLKIEGVKLVQLGTPPTFQYPFVDDRGILYEVWHASDKYVPEVKQVYVVNSFSPESVRAFHKHANLFDLFIIIRGTAKFVLVDDREDSPTYYKQMEVMDVVVLTAENPRLLVVPPGVFHGWKPVVPEGATLLSLATEEYIHDNPDEVRIDPYTFGDVWTVKGR